MSLLYDSKTNNLYHNDIKITFHTLVNYIQGFGNTVEEKLNNFYNTLSYSFSEHSISKENGNHNYNDFINNFYTDLNYRIIFSWFLIHDIKVITFDLYYHALDNSNKESIDYTDDSIKHDNKENKYKLIPYSDIYNDYILSFIFSSEWITLLKKYSNLLYKLYPKYINHITAFIHYNDIYIKSDSKFNILDDSFSIILLEKIYDTFQSKHDIKDENIKEESKFKLSDINKIEVNKSFIYKDCEDNIEYTIPSGDMNSIYENYDSKIKFLHKRIRDLDKLLRDKIIQKCDSIDLEPITKKLESIECQLKELRGTNYLQY